ncbi:ERF family ssDNA binding protein [Microbacterium phage Megan]|uniref:ERF family ssDNA binding protein n=1 Tax=Microbacterium phage Megan TaxID=2656551 RepID=A0A649VK33_9CAUD|nr:ERF family ssDNA binding protein [Microbacterium phage Megan]QGJ92717.1 ERF family ssDNA binding protein [Microbacterium phage Megan]
MSSSLTQHERQNMADSTAPAEAQTPAEYPTLWDALAAFQRTLPSIRKGQTATVTRKDGGQGYSYDYADLTDVSEVVLPALGAVGLAWHTALDTREDGTLTLRWELVHGPSGDSRTGSIPVGRSGQDWQGIGSAITYARRYALTAATGVAPGGDDNDGADGRAGASAGTPPKREVQQKPEYLPAGLYDLGGLTDVEAVRVMFRRARVAGHLPLLVLSGDDEVPLGQYLTDLGSALAEPAKQDEAAEATDDAASADTSQDDEDAAEAAAVAAHEAELAKAERETAQAPRADDDAPEGDR